jgi:hypothetical protein
VDRDEGRSRRGFWRSGGRGVEKVVDVLDLVESVFFVLRVVAAFFRLLGRVLDAWW